MLNNAPESKVYKDTLWALLKKAKPSAVQYSFDRYEHINDTDYLYVTVEGAVQGTAVVTVREWDEPIEKIKAFKGKGYGGAELKNLRLDVESDSVTTSLIYKGADELAD